MVDSANSSLLNTIVFAMSKKHNRYWEITGAVIDLGTTALAFYAAFWLRFQAGFLPHANPDPGDYLIMLDSVGWKRWDALSPGWSLATTV